MQKEYFTASPQETYIIKGIGGLAGALVLVGGITYKYKSDVSFSFLGSGTALYKSWRATAQALRSDPDLSYDRQLLTNAFKAINAAGDTGKITRGQYNVLRNAVARLNQIIQSKKSDALLGNGQEIDKLLETIATTLET